MTTTIILNNCGSIFHVDCLDFQNLINIHTIKLNFLCYYIQNHIMKILNSYRTKNTIKDHERLIKIIDLLKREEVLRKNYHYLRIQV